jgi:hypothetical protein
MIKICMNLTRQEVTIAHGAVSSYADNQHDMGAGEEGWGAMIIQDALNVLNHMISKSDDTAMPRRFNLGVFAVMQDAVATYCSEPADIESDQAAAEMLFAERLEKADGVTLITTNDALVHDRIRNCEPRLLKEAITESLHGGLDGWMPSQRQTIVAYLTDAALYVEEAIKP